MRPSIRQRGGALWLILGLARGPMAAATCDGPAVRGSGRRGGRRYVRYDQPVRERPSSCSRRSDPTGSTSARGRLSKDVVLTAAHCTDFLVEEGPDGFGPDDLRVSPLDGTSCSATVDHIIVPSAWFAAGPRFATEARLPRPWPMADPALFGLGQRWDHACRTRGCRLPRHARPGRARPSLWSATARMRISRGVVCGAEGDHAFRRHPQLAM